MQEITRGGKLLKMRYLARTLAAEEDSEPGSLTPTPRSVCVKAVDKGLTLRFGVKAVDKGVTVVRRIPPRKKGIPTRWQERFAGAELDCRGKKEESGDTVSRTLTEEYRTFVYLSIN